MAMEKTSKCPKCNYVSTDEEFSVCPKCSIIIKKYYDTLETRQKLEAERLEKKKKEEEAYIVMQQEIRGKEPREKKRWTKGRKVATLLVSFIVIAGFLIYLYYYYNYSYQPHKIAEEYLKAVQLHDYATIKKISSISEDSILINLIDWQFVHKNNIPSEKTKIDLSEDAWRKEVELALTAFQVSSVSFLPFPDLILNGYKDYNVWFDNRLKLYKAFNEGENYFYIKSPIVEYLLDITATNKLGTELRKKYILLLNKGDAGWIVIEFKERE